MTDAPSNAPWIALIAAMGNHRVIGIENRLPWYLPADFKHFKELTLGKPVLMGRRTYDSIGRPLPGRRNIVVTRDPRFRPEGVTVVSTIVEALAQAAPAPEIMVIGGASFYEQMLPRAHRLYLTFVHGDFEGDAYFPAWDTQEWEELERQDFPADDSGSPGYSFVTLGRRAV